MKPFHLSFAVPDLKQARQFYQDTLGCAVGRDQGSWIDVILFGHQITVHQESEHMKSRPIDHFGPILDKSEWENVRERCESAGVEFSMRPLILADGTAQESGKFTIKDPADNVIEFKYYGDGKEPDRSEEDITQEDWTVWRQDDNANVFMMQSGLTHAQAQSLVAEYEARGHKQHYWMNRNRKADW